MMIDFRDETNQRDHHFWTDMQYKVVNTDQLVFNSVILFRLYSGFLNPALKVKTGILFRAKGVKSETELTRRSSTNLRTWILPISWAIWSLLVAAQSARLWVSSDRRSSVVVSLNGLKVSIMFLEWRCLFVMWCEESVKLVSESCSNCRRRPKMSGPAMIHWQSEASLSVKTIAPPFLLTNAFSYSCDDQ